MLLLVEECSGRGALSFDGGVTNAVQYSLRRFQGVMEGSGLPIPGLHRIEGTLEFNARPLPREWIGVPVNLRLEDGRLFRITVVNSDGRILTEGHGPVKCVCC
jgi:hypothetical protein